MQQFNKLIEFRQTIYDHALTRVRDAQFELVDALLLSAPIHTFPELSCSPVFRRQWYSAYTAVEDGRQDREWLERYLAQQLPADGCLVFSLDGTPSNSCFMLLLNFDISRWIAKLDRIALWGASSRARGAPNKAMIPSPVISFTVPS